MEPVFFNWFHLAGIENWLSSVREKSLSVYDLLPQWVVFSLPGGLWAYAYSLIILSIWAGRDSFLKYFWFLSIPAMIFGFEILQLTGKLPGTFCLNDLYWSAIGITIGFLTVFINRKRDGRRINLDKNIKTI